MKMTKIENTIKSHSKTIINKLNNAKYSSQLLSSLIVITAIVIEITLRQLPSALPVLIDHPIISLSTLVLSCLSLLAAKWVAFDSWKEFIYTLKWLLKIIQRLRKPLKYMEW